RSPRETLSQNIAAQQNDIYHRPLLAQKGKRAKRVIISSPSGCLIKAAHTASAAYQGTARLGGAEPRLQVCKEARQPAYLHASENRPAYDYFLNTISRGVRNGRITSPIVSSPVSSGSWS